MNQMHSVRTYQSCVLMSTYEKAGTGTSQKQIKQDLLHFSLTNIFSAYLRDFAHMC